VRAFLAVPGHPFGGCQLDVVDAPPRFATTDQFRLVGGVDRFGEGVVVAIATGPDRGSDPEFGQAVGISQR
jgi:hypothetical protein